MNGIRLGSLLGLPIYTLNDGTKLGNVKDVVFDGVKHELVGFTVEERGIIFLRRMVIPFSNVKSLGPDAIMVEDGGVFQREKQVPFVKNALRQKNGTMRNKALLAESGINLGSISEVLIDKFTGRAIGYEVSGGLAKDIGSGRNCIDTPESIHVGNNAVIVPDKTAQMLEAQEPGGALGAYQSAKEQVSEYTTEQEIKMSLGKTVGRDVLDDAEYMIVAKGETVTQHVIDEAVDKGKMHEVALAAGVGGAQEFGGAARERTGPIYSETKGRLAEAWSNLVGATHESIDAVGRARAVSAQKNS